MSRSAFAKVLCVLATACEPGATVQVESLPVAAVVDAGDPSVVSDAGSGGAPLLFAEPPGLVEGPAAESLRASASGAIVDIDDMTPVFSFVPLDAAGGGEAVRLTPATLSGWGSGPRSLGVLASNPAAGVAFLLRGGANVLRAVAVGSTAVLKSDHGRDRAQVETAERGLADAVPTNGLYRVALDGKDADAPSPLAEGLAFSGPTLYSASTRQIFVTLEGGLAVLPDAQAAAPTVVRPNPPESEFQLVGISEAAGRVIFTEHRKIENVLPIVLVSGAVAVWSLSVAEPAAPPTLLYRPPAVESGSSVHRLDDRWFLVDVSRESSVLLDATGELEPIDFGDAFVAGLPRVVGDALVYQGHTSPDETFTPTVLLARTLEAGASRSPRELNAAHPESLLWAAADPQGEHLAFPEGEGARVVRLDGGEASLLRVSPGRAGTSEVGFSPDGRTVLVVTNGPEGLGVEALPRSGAAGRILVPPEPAIYSIDLAQVEARGHFLVLREADDRATLTRVGVDGVAEPEVRLSGHLPSVQPVPGGVLVRSVAGGRRLDAVTPDGLESVYAARDSASSWRLAPGGRYALTDAYMFADDRLITPGIVAVDLLHQGTPQVVTPPDFNGLVEGLRADAAVVWQFGSVNSPLTLVPLAQGWDAARPYAAGNGFFVQDLPGLGAVAVVVDDPIAETRTLVLAPDGGGAPEVIGLIPRYQSVELRESHEPRALVAVVHDWDAAGGTFDSLLRWSLAPAGAPVAEPVVVAPPGLTVATLDALPDPDTFLVSGQLEGVAGLWRLDFGAAPEGRLAPLAPPGLSVPSSAVYRAGIDVLLDAETKEAPHALDSERTVVLAAGPEEVTGDFAVRPISIIHLDGRDREGVAPLLGGQGVLDGSARLFPDGGHVSFATEGGQVGVVAARPDAQPRMLGTTGLGWWLSSDGDRYRPPFEVARGGRRWFVFLDDSTGELAVTDPDDGTRDVRASFPPAPATGQPVLLRLTPDGRAAVVGFTGPTGRRLYLVALEGVPAVAHLVPGDAPANESLLTFRP